MNALLESLAAGFDGTARQRAALDALVRGGLPNPRSEAWKYTSLRALERRTFVRAEPGIVIEAGLLDSIPTPRLVFVNGAFAPALSHVAELPEGVELTAHQVEVNDADEEILSSSLVDDVFARLNGLLSAGGATLEVAADTSVEATVHLVFVGTPAGEDLAWHVRTDIVVGKNSRMTVVEHHLASGEHAHLANTVARIELRESSRLNHVRLQCQAQASTCFLRTDAVLEARARYERLDLELGAAMSRHELKVRLAGDGAALGANGVQLAQGRRHLDTQLDIEHLARDTTCDLTWRGLGAGRGRVVFHGGITIRPGADGSDATLSSKNLLLSDSAEIDTQPVLEIHADEVKAAHGATVGEIDRGALFYLRSRGLPEAVARQLLTAAFCRAPLAIVRDDALRELLFAKVDGALDGLPVE